MDGHPAAVTNLGIPNTKAKDGIFIHFDTQEVTIDTRSKNTPTRCTGDPSHILQVTGPPPPRAPSVSSSKRRGPTISHGVKQISPKVAHQWLTSGTPPGCLLDVREDYETSIASIHVPEGVTALHIPMHEIEMRAGEIPDDGRGVVVVCHIGRRSAAVVEYLREKRGLKKVVNLFGGVDEWSRQVDSTVPRY